MLIALTSVLAVAVVVLSGVTWRLIHIERQRSNARISALAYAIDDPSWTPEVNESGNEVLPGTTGPALFAAGTSSARHAPAFVIGTSIVGLVAALVLFAARPDHHPTPRPVAVPLAAPLELLSMRHALDGDRLIVTGLVRNPSGSETAALTAVVSAVGRDGQVVARGQARLNPDVLAPGKETAFRVTVAHANDLDRYRLSFVHDDQVVPHVDRRTDLTRTAMATD